MCGLEVYVTYLDLKAITTISRLKVLRHKYFQEKFALFRGHQNSLMAQGRELRFASPAGDVLNIREPMVWQFSSLNKKTPQGKGGTKPWGEHLKGGR
jgi:hypothetical protein